MELYVPEPKRLPSGSYFIQLRLGGESVSVTAPTKQECKIAAEQIKSDHRAGKRATKKKDLPTLEEAMNSYIENKRNILSPSTIRGYTGIRDNRYRDVIKQKIDSIDYQAMVNHDSADHKAKTVKNGWRFVCSVLRENGVTPPAVALPQIIQEEHPYLEPDQIKPFVEAIKEEPCQVAALLGLHSLRRSEIVALTWDNVDLKNGLIHVRGAAVYNEDNKLIRKATNKNTSSRRTVPIMIPALSEALGAVPADERRGQVVTVTPNAILKQVNRACRKHGFPEIGVHGLRHSFASLAFSSDVGLSEREVMELGGWSDPQTVHKIYEHLARKNRLKAANKMAAFFQNANKNANESSDPLKTQAL